MTLKKITSICIRLAGVAVLLVVEDSLLWVTPGLTELALSSSHATVFRARCQQIKAGMSRNEVVRIMHHGTRIWSESDRLTGMNGAGRELDFRGAKSACTVTVDPETGKALGVHLELPGGMSYD